MMPAKPNQGVWRRPWGRDGWGSRRRGRAAGFLLELVDLAMALVNVMAGRVALCLRLIACSQQSNCTHHRTPTKALDAGGMTSQDRWQGCPLDSPNKDGADRVLKAWL